MKNDKKIKKVYGRVKPQERGPVSPHTEAKDLRLGEELTQDSLLPTQDTLDELPGQPDADLIDEIMLGMIEDEEMERGTWG